MQRILRIIQHAGVEISVKSARQIDPASWIMASVSISFFLKKHLQSLFHAYIISQTFCHMNYIIKKVIIFIEMQTDDINLTMQMNSYLFLSGTE